MRLSRLKLHNLLHQCFLERRQRFSMRLVPLQRTHDTVGDRGVPAEQFLQLLDGRDGLRGASHPENDMVNMEWQGVITDCREEGIEGRVIAADNLKWCVR